MQDPATPNCSAGVSREAGSLVPGPLLLSARYRMSLWSPLNKDASLGLSPLKGRHKQARLWSYGCCSYSQAGCLGSYKEHHHPPFPFTLAFWEPVFLQRWRSGFGGFILVEDVDTNPPSEPWFFQSDSSLMLSDCRYFHYPNTWELEPF